MNKTLKLIATIIIVAGCYLGIRYLGTFIHYACTAPGEDCPPPFRIVGEAGYVLTGGNLVPLWRQN
jgi:hypothetical protein